MEDDPVTAASDHTKAIRRIQRLSLHLHRPIPTRRHLVPSPCGGSKLSSPVNPTALSEYMMGRHREVQERIFEFFLSRPNLQTPVEIFTADHRQLCMRQLSALVHEVGIRPLWYIADEPSLYFTMLEVVGSIDISLKIKMGV